MNEQIILVDPFSSGFELRKTAKEMGYKVIAVITWDSEITKGFDLESDFDDVIMTKDPEEVMKRLKDIDTIKGVIAAAEPAVEMADILADKLGLVGNSIDLSEARRNKFMMREVLSNKNIPMPLFKKCFNESDVEEFSRNVSFPIVIKTPRGAGTDMVYIRNDLAGLLQSFHKIITTKNVFGESSSYALLEEYIYGTEYCINYFATGEDIIVTDIWRYDKEDSHSATAVYKNTCLELDHGLHVAKIEYGKKCIEGLNIKYGPVHLEIKGDENKHFLIEVATRLAGGYIPFLVSQNSEFNYFKKTIEVFTKGRLSEWANPIHIKKDLAICTCITGSKGTVSKINGLELIESLPSYSRHWLRTQVGNSIAPTIDLNNTPLVVWLVNESSKELTADIEKVHEIFSLETT